MSTRFTKVRGSVVHLFSELVFGDSKTPGNYPGLVNILNSYQDLDACIHFLERAPVAKCRLVVLHRAGKQAFLGLKASASSTTVVVLFIFFANALLDSAARTTGGLR